VPRLLVVHHTPSPTLQELLEAVLDGATNDAIEDVEVVARPALTASDVDAIEADGYVLGTPANIGYMSGALKHFFDRVYYPAMEASRGRPYGVYVHGSSDTGGALRAISSIAQGMGWRGVTAAVEVVGAPTAEDREACWNLGATVAAALSTDYA
jgi:multimeric flavodoxin WrbA